MTDPPTDTDHERALADATARRLVALSAVVAIGLVQVVAGVGGASYALVAAYGWQGLAGIVPLLGLAATQAALVAAALLAWSTSPPVGGSEDW